jgi:hypothetical protein
MMNIKKRKKSSIVRCPLKKYVGSKVSVNKCRRCSHYVGETNDTIECTAQ